MVELKADFGIKPACEGLSRAETTSLLNRELVRLKLTRRNAYSYWAHEVELHDEKQGKYVRVDFVQFEPYSHHTAIDAGYVEKGTFAFYEVKSCLDDIKSGHGLNFFGDENYLVMPVECYEKFKRAYHGERGEDYDKKLREAIGSLASFSFLLYGLNRQGGGKFVKVGEPYYGMSRRKATSELLLCMMRAMIANSSHSDVQHHIERGFES